MFLKQCYKTNSIWIRDVDLKAVRGGESALAMAKRRYSTVYVGSCTVKDSDLNFFWTQKLSAGGLNFGLDSQYGNWNISSLNSPIRGILYSMVWRCNLRVVKVNIAFSCHSFMVRRLMFRFGLKFITANLLFMFNRMIVCVCQEHKP